MKIDFFYLKFNAFLFYTIYIPIFIVMCIYNWDVDAIGIFLFGGILATIVYYLAWKSEYFAESGGKSA